MSYRLLLWRFWRLSPRQVQKGALTDYYSERTEKHLALAPPPCFKIRAALSPARRRKALGEGGGSQFQVLLQCLTDYYSGASGGCPPARCRKAFLQTTTLR